MWSFPSFGFSLFIFQYIFHIFSIWTGDISILTYYNTVLKNRMSNNSLRNYEIKQKLGSGSYGVIYKAYNKIDKSICVLKQISLSRMSEKARKNVLSSSFRLQTKRILWGNWNTPSLYAITNLLWKIITWTYLWSSAIVVIFAITWSSRIKNFWNRKRYGNFLYKSAWA